MLGVWSVVVQQIRAIAFHRATRHQEGRVRRNVVGAAAAGRRRRRLLDASVHVTSAVIERVAVVGTGLCLLVRELVAARLESAQAR